MIAPDPTWMRRLSVSGFGLERLRKEQMDIKRISTDELTYLFHDGRRPKRKESISRYIKDGMPYYLKEHENMWREYEYDVQEVVEWYENRFPERKIHWDKFREYLDGKK